MIDHHGYKARQMEILYEYEQRCNRLREEVKTDNTIALTQSLVKAKTEAAHALDELMLEAIGNVNDAPYFVGEPENVGKFTGTIETLNEVRANDARSWYNAGRNKLRQSLRSIVKGSAK